MWDSFRADLPDDASSKAEGPVLRRDPAEIAAIQENTWLQRAEILRDDLRDKGWEDGSQMEEFVMSQMDQWRTEAAQTNQIYFGTPDTTQADETLEENDVPDASGDEACAVKPDTTTSDASTMTDSEKDEDMPFEEDAISDAEGPKSDVSVQATDSLDEAGNPEEGLPADHASTYPSGFDYSGVDWAQIYHDIETEHSSEPLQAYGSSPDSSSDDLLTEATEESAACDDTLPTDNPSDRMSIQSARDQAIHRAWEKEADRVREGKGTWDWTVEQQAEMLRRSHTSNPGVSGFEGSHMLSAKDYPEHAGNPDNIQLIPTIAHFDGVHERNPRDNTPSGRYDPKTGEVVPVGDGTIPELPVFDLADRYEPDQHEFHDSHPEFEQSGEGREQGFKETRERHPEKSIGRRK